MLVAVTCTVIGFFIDSQSGNQLTNTFGALYVIGCVIAVLIVRYRGLFTTLVQPPLLLFVAVPVAYQLMLGESGGLGTKEILLNLVIPLVNRFPTMALATVLVLAIGAGRMVLHRREQEANGDGARKPRARTSRPAAAARGQRTRAADAKDPARRRFRSNADATPDAETDAEATPRASRRPAGRTAERPPRVSNPSRSATDRKPADRQRAATDRSRGDRPATERSRTERPATAERPAAADRSRGDRQRAANPAADRQATPNRKPPAERRAAPAGERRANPDRAANPVAEPRRRRSPNGELPPHPRPNVRYRERDSGRIER